MKDPICALARLDPESPMRVLARHAGSCLPCQAALARGRRLSRELRSLGHVVETAPPSLVTAVATQIRTTSAGSADGAVSRMVAGVTAAGAFVATAAAAVVLWRRSHAAV
jgi:hypothetical protein